MFSEIINHLNFSSIAQNKCVVVTKDVITDINFVFCEILSHYFNKNYTVILINFAQSNAHYNHVLLKSGVNMRVVRENHQFLTIDGLAEIEKLANFVTPEENQNAAFRDLFSNSVSRDNCVQSLYFLIEETVKKLRDESKPFILFIDDISSLLNLGLDEKNIVTLVAYFRSLCFSDANAQNILLLGSVYEKKDVLNKKLVDYLFYLADVRIQVEGLKTGFSQDVHGKISLNIRKLTDGTLDSQKMLFKVTEEGAVLYTLDV